MNETRPPRPLKAFVTGGSRGIGAAVCALLRERGIDVFDTPYAKNPSLRERIMNRGFDASIVPDDITRHGHKKT